MDATPRRLPDHQRLWAGPARPVLRHRRLAASVVEGSANRITAHAACTPYPGHRYQYRTKVDVDVIGALDPPDKQYFEMSHKLP
jgi:hypothetical protein